MNPSTLYKSNTSRKRKNVRKYAPKGFSPLRRLKSFYYGRFPNKIPAQSFYPSQPPSRSPPKPKYKTFTKRFRSYFNWLLGKPSSSPLAQPIVRNISQAEAARERRNELIKELTYTTSPATLRRKQLIKELTKTPSTIRTSSINKELINALTFRSSPIFEEQVAVLPTTARKSSSIQRQQDTVLPTTIKKPRPRSQKKGIRSRKPLPPITFETPVYKPVLNWSKVVQKNRY